ncbi:MAG: hypothetical protein LBQ46_06215 [Treponema sp.]|jgi:hypothetical protein|nr:hypothetical protein [Treponema sp.]
MHRSRQDHHETAVLPREISVIIGIDPSGEAPPVKQRASIATAAAKKQPTLNIGILLLPGEFGVLFDGG